MKLVLLIVITTIFFHGVSTFGLGDWFGNAGGGLTGFNRGHGSRGNSQISGRIGDIERGFVGKLGNAFSRLISGRRKRSLT